MEMKEFFLSNAHGVKVSLLNWGGTLKSLWVPDQKGILADVVLGFDTPDEYRQKHPYFGALIGRVCNRVAGGSFTLQEKNYQLNLNDGRHHLHGGNKGFDK